MASVDQGANGASSSGSSVSGSSGGPRRRTLRLLIDDVGGGGSGSGSTGGLRRLSVQAGSLEELHSAVRAAVRPQRQPQQPGAAAAATAPVQREEERDPAAAVDLELYDPLQERFGPLPADFAALPTVLRLRVSSSPNATSSDGSSSSGKGDHAGATLALPWRRFPMDLEREGFEVGGRRLVVRGVENSGQGTGHTTWDGAVLLAKYLEHDSGRGRMKGKRVLETGAGTGLVGLACAALGAKEVLLTDLPYTLGNLEANARRNEAALAGSGARVRVLEGDWFKPPIGAGEADALGPVDLIVAADVVWLDELVAPLAKYLRAVLDRPGSRHAEALMAYQTRSTRTESLLLEELGRAGLTVERVDPAEQHPEFRAPGVLHILRIRL